jgi:putative flippase GtrA
MKEFFRFGMVGVAGFLIDVGVLYLSMRFFGTGPYIGRAVSYLAAASATWYLNRRITFAVRRNAALGPEWLKFVLFNAVGGSVNYATYTACLHFLGFSGLAPAYGVALGSVSGLCVNFTLSSQLVFRKSSLPVKNFAPNRRLERDL